MLEIFRAPDKTTRKLLPVVMLQLGTEDVILTEDEGALLRRLRSVSPNQ